MNQDWKASSEPVENLTEIDMTISLNAINPEWKEDWLASEKGEIAFELDLKFFKQNYPDHWFRKIQTFAIQIPTFIELYRDLSAKLTQTSSYIQSKPGNALQSLPLVSEQIVLTKGINDSGTVVIDFHDDRTLPFAGTGAISCWTLVLPRSGNRWTIENILDLVIVLRYTAKSVR